MPVVNHLRLFGCRLDTDTAAVRWLLQSSGKTHDVEHIEVNSTACENLTDAFARRNSFQSIPLLEIVFDGSSGALHGTKKASDLPPWKPGATCKPMHPTDRVLQITEFGAICAFLCEHFRIPGLWEPRSVFLRCRTQEYLQNSEVLSRRIDMALAFILTKAHGATDDDVVTAIMAQERDLLWSFRQIEDTLIEHERTTASARGLNYDDLVEEGAREVAAKEQAEQESREKAGDADGHVRVVTSPTLVALDAYSTGRTLTIADFLVCADLQGLPYFQSWLPESLRQRNFPAILRYLDRMRKIDGYDGVLKPFLAFLKLFRRRPRVIADNKMLTIITLRLKKMLEASNKSTDHVSQYCPDISLLPAQHKNAMESADGAPRNDFVSATANKNSNTSSSTSRRAQSGRSRRSRRQPELTPWAPRMLEAPLRPYHHVLSEKDEDTLRGVRKSAQSADRRPTFQRPFSSHGSNAQQRVGQEGPSLPQARQPTSNNTNAAPPYDGSPYTQHRAKTVDQASRLSAMRQFEDLHGGAVDTAGASRQRASMVWKRDPYAVSPEAEIAIDVDRIQHQEPPRYHELEVEHGHESSRRTTTWQPQQQRHQEPQLPPHAHLHKQPLSRQHQHHNQHQQNEYMYRHPQPQGPYHDSQHTAEARYVSESDSSMSVVKYCHHVRPVVSSVSPSGRRPQSSGQVPAYSTDLQGTIRVTVPLRQQLTKTR